MTAKAKKARAKKGNSRLTRELLETARDMRAGGVLTKSAHDKITMRHAGIASAVPVTLTGKEIKSLREKANLSQAVLATYLNVTAGYISQLERETARPKGAALVLLDVIRRKGLEAIL
jgi:putative transcriptional regulator